ncbi:MAG: hypothetical protein ABSD78_16255 [Acidimicrobiales bacterium]
MPTEFLDVVRPATVAVTSGKHWSGRRGDGGVHAVAELGPHGVRVCGIWTAGVAETLSKERLIGAGGPGAPEP